MRSCLSDWAWLLSLPLAILAASAHATNAFTPPVAAHYATTTCELPCTTPATWDWLLWRQPDQIEIRSASGETGELWRRDERGRIGLIYLEPSHRRGISYSANDLLALGKAASWERLNGLVAPAELAGLTLVEETRSLGQPARRYAGRIGERAVDVIWLPELGLASRISNRYPDHERTIELKALNAAVSNAGPTREQDLAGYQLVEYTDLGDMETNPSMAWLKHVRRAPGAEAHSH